MDSIPKWPQGWYAIARSESLSKKQIIPCQIAQHELVIFRTAQGKVAAVYAYCAHMGAHLKNAEVDGENLKCSLHHFCTNPQGEIQSSAEKPPLKSQHWRAEEHFGLVFVCIADDPKNRTFPVADSANDLWLSGSPVKLNADWRTIIVNGHDILHMKVVHQRALTEPIEFDISPLSLEMKYKSKVLEKGGLSSWLTKLISRKGIAITSTCYGNMILIQSHIGTFKTQAIFSVLPSKDHTATVFPSFSVSRDSFLATLQLRMAKALYIAFLKKDYTVIDGMKLKVTDPITDVGIEHAMRFLRKLKPISD